MEHNDEELRLAPIEDDELGLAPIEDEDAQKTIAPDIPYNTGTRLIPVICSACKTRLYAGEDQVGLWKRCPDCGRLTEIFSVPPKFVLIADDPEAAGGYNIQEPEVSNRDILQIRTENQKSFEEYQEKQKQNQNRISNQLPPPVFIDQPPIMEGMLNRLLKSREEKNEENAIIRQQQEIEKETEAIKKAARNGTLEAYLAGSENNLEKSVDWAAQKLIEKQQPQPLQQQPQQQQQQQQQQPPFEPPARSLLSVLPAPLPPPLPHPLPPPLPPTLTVFPPPLPPEIPLPPPLLFPADSERLDSSSRSHSSDSHSSGLQHSSSGSLCSPLFDASCRSRIVILTICGFLGNLTGEKSRSMIWQIVFDRVYGQSAGYSYNLMESGFFFINFWFGAILSIVWLSMLFLFGISLFLETASGKDRVEHWIPFDLDFGFSYIGWSCLILFVSGFPGFIIWQGTSFFLPDKESILILLHFIGQFLCFPILFLCVIESDTFYGNYPRQTLTSLYQHPRLWLQLYAKAIILVGVPLVILVSLFFAGIAWANHWFMQSFFYYFITAVLLTFCGYFVLLYFRLLGKTAWEIRLRQHY